MKDKMKTFEEFEARLKSQVIPAVPCRSELGQGIAKRQKVLKPFYLRVSFIAIFLSICATATIATAMQYTGWKLFNTEGKEVFELKTMSEEEAEPHLKQDEIMGKYRVTEEKLGSTITEGKFLYFLTVDGYEELKLSGGFGIRMLQNGKGIESVTQIPKNYKEPLLLIDTIQVPEEIKDSLYFKGEGQDKLVLSEGTIRYNTPHLEAVELEALTNDMYAEAKESNLDYIVREGILTDEISHINLMYNESQEGFGGIEITLQSANEGISTTENVADFTKVTEDGVDFLYDAELQRVFFIVEDNDKKLLVTVRFLSKWIDQHVEKEDVIAIAKSILK